MDNKLSGKRAFVAGVADDNGYGWAIAKSLAAAGAEILVGTWVPVCVQHTYKNKITFFYPNKNTITLAQIIHVGTKYF